MFNKWLNPHVARVHIPAHLLATSAVAYGAATFTLTDTLAAALVFLVFNVWLSALGMSIGFHRYFTHRAFTTNRFWRQVMLWGGTFAGQGSVVFWVALHRLHHPNSDRPKDVHSPRQGFWHSYMGWIFTLDPTKVPLSMAVDIIRDPVARFTHRQYDKIMWLYWAHIIGLSIALDVPQLAVGALIAGCWSIHQEALINSVCHSTRYGTAPYPSADDSRNVHALHYITWGQSLHHNHHVWPKSANFDVDGRSDIGHRIIRLIEVDSVIVNQTTPSKGNDHVML